MCHWSQTTPRWVQEGAWLTPRAHTARKRHPDSPLLSLLRGIQHSAGVPATQRGGTEGAAGGSPCHGLNGRSTNTARQLFPTRAYPRTLHPVQPYVTRFEFIYLGHQKNRKQDLPFYPCSPIGPSPAILIFQAFSFMDRTMAAC